MKGRRPARNCAPEPDGLFPVCFVWLSRGRSPAACGDGSPAPGRSEKAERKVAAAQIEWLAAGRLRYAKEQLAYVGLDNKDVNQKQAHGKERLQQIVKDHPQTEG